MPQIRKQILHLFFFSLISGLFAQEPGPSPRIDSLIDANEQDYRKHPEASKERAQKILRLSEQASYPKGKAIALSQYGNALYVQGAYDSAIWYHKESILWRQAAGDTVGEGLAWQNIGNVWFERGVHDQALENFFVAESIFRQYEKPLFLGTVYNNIGMVYASLDRMKDAVEILLKAVELFEKLEREDKLAMTYNNLNGIYIEKEQYDQAEKYAKLSLEISRRTGDKKSLANGLANLGYLSFYQKRFQEAEQQFEEALERYLDLGNPFGELHAYHGLGLAQHGQGRTSEAIENMLHSLQLVEKLKADQHFFEFHKELAEMYGSLEWNAEAYASYRTYAQLSDSLRSEEFQQKLAEMTERFNSERKDLQIREGQLLVEKRDTQIFALALGSGLLLLLLFVAIRAYMQKQRSNRLLSEQKAIIQEKNEQITESIHYARRIQEALLPPESLLKSLLPQAQVLYLPRDEVSGDFYWIAETTEGLILVVADCTGHGVPGAFMSMMGHTLLHEIVGEKGITAPGQILHLMNAAVETALRQEGQDDQEDGMDLSIVRMDFTRGKIHFSGANSRAWLIQDQQVRRLEGGLFSVGGMTIPGMKKDYPESVWDWRAGDRLVLATDGYWDQFGGPEGKKLGLQRMEEAMRESPQAPFSSLEKLYEEWKRAETQTDDVLMVVL